MLHNIVTQTVLLTFPFLQANIMSQTWPDIITVISVTVTTTVLANGSSSYQAVGQGWHASSLSLLQLLQGSHSNP